MLLWLVWLLFTVTIKRVSHKTHVHLGNLLCQICLWQNIAAWIAFNAESKKVFPSLAAVAMNGCTGRCQWKFKLLVMVKVQISMTFLKTECIGLKNENENDNGQNSQLCQVGVVTSFSVDACKWLMDFLAFDHEHLFDSTTHLTELLPTQTNHVHVITITSMKQFAEIQSNSNWGCPDNLFI